MKMPNRLLPNMVLVFAFLSMPSHALDHKEIWQLVLDSPERAELYKALKRDNLPHFNFQKFILDCAQQPACMAHGHALFAVIEQREKHPDWSYEDVHDELLNKFDVSFNVDRQTVEKFEALNPQVLEYVFSEPGLSKAMLLARVQDVVNRKNLCVDEQQKLKPKERVSKVDSEMKSYCWVESSWGYELDRLLRK
jgi:hypothetical protein